MRALGGLALGADPGLEVGPIIEDEYVSDVFPADDLDVVYGVCFQPVPVINGASSPGERGKQNSFPHFVRLSFSIVVDSVDHVCMAIVRVLVGERADRDGLVFGTDVSQSRAERTAAADD